MKKYDAGDLLDQSALGLEAVKWLSLAISDIHKDIDKIKNEMIERNLGNQYAFHEIITKLDMFEYLADHLIDTHENNVSRYKEEMKEGQA